MQGLLHLLCLCRAAEPVGAEVIVVDLDVEIVDALPRQGGDGGGGLMQVPQGHRHRRAGAGAEILLQQGPDRIDARAAGLVEGVEIELERF